MVAPEATLAALAFGPRRWTEILFILDAMRFRDFGVTRYVVLLYPRSYVCKAIRWRLPKSCQARDQIGCVALRRWLSIDDSNANAVSWASSSSSGESLSDAMWVCHGSRGRESFDSICSNSER